MKLREQLIQTMKGQSPLAVYIWNYPLWKTLILYWVGFYAVLTQPKTIDSKQYHNDGGASRATAPGRKSTVVHFGAIWSTNSLPTHRLGSSGRALNPAMHPCSAESSAAFALLPGASNEREERSFFLLLFAVATVLILRNLSLFEWAHLTA